ncbi:FecR family protein [Porticoccus sp. GXU_MW_L64]
MKTEFDNNALLSLDEHAAYWLVRLSASDCSPEDRYAFETWKREDPAHEAAYLKIQRGNALVDHHIAHPALRNIGKQALEQTRPSSKRRQWLISSAIAATVLLAVSALLVINPASNTTNEAPTARVAVYETAIGERSTMTLADGSVITLNTNTRIEVDYSATQRNLTLLRGQGYFDVAKDPTRPFAIQAGNKRVVAIGTEFEVHLDPHNNVEVTLVEGVVSVDQIAPAESHSQNPPAAPFSPIKLAPGERLIAAVDTPMQVVQTNTAEATSWRSGRLIFRGEPIANAIAEINRYSTQQLKLADDNRVQAMTVSGVFNTGRASSFVDALERMHPLQAVATGDNELTLEWE